LQWVAHFITFLSVSIFGCAFYTANSFLWNLVKQGSDQNSLAYQLDLPLVLLVT
jgi:hypothetical protein